MIRNFSMKLNEFAKVLTVHPRTVLRAMTGEENPYWTPDFDPSFAMNDFYEAYSIDAKVFRRVWLSGTDILLKPVDAAIFLKLPARTFRYQKYHAAIRIGGVVRYSRKSLINEKLRRDVAKSKR